MATLQEINLLKQQQKLTEAKKHKSKKNYVIPGITSDNPKYSEINSDLQKLNNTDPELVNAITNWG